MKEKDHLSQWACWIDFSQWSLGNCGLMANTSPSSNDGIWDIRILHGAKKDVSPTLLVSVTLNDDFSLKLRIYNDEYIDNNENFPGYKRVMIKSVMEAYLQAHRFILLDRDFEKAKKIFAGIQIRSAQAYIDKERQEEYLVADESH